MAKRDLQKRDAVFKTASSWKSQSLRMLFYLACLLLWEIIAAFVNPIFLVGPMAVLRSGYRLFFETGILWRPLGITLAELASTLCLAIVLGIVLGITLGLSRTVRFLLNPAVNALYAIPRIVFVPILILWFGIGFVAKVAIGVSLGAFPILIATSVGLQSAGKHYAEVVLSFGGSQWQAIRMALLPGALPQIVTGVQLGAGMALIGVVVGEMFTALEGLGGFIVEAAHNFRTDDLLLATAVIGVMGAATVWLAGWLPRRMAPWHFQGIVR